MKNKISLKKIIKQSVLHLRKGIMWLIVFSMVLIGIPGNEVEYSAADTIHPTLTTSVSVETNDDVHAIDGKYIVSNGAEVRLTINIQANGLVAGDKLQGLYSYVNLGFFDLNNNQSEIDGGYGGVKGRVTSTSETWIAQKNFDPVTGTTSNGEYTNSTDIYTGEDMVVYYNELHSLEAGKTYGYTINLSFMDETRENAVFIVESFAGYGNWIQDNDGTVNSHKIDYKSTSKQTTLVNSNLIWNADYEILTGASRETGMPLWQEYNYQDISLTMKNESEKPGAYLDEFEYVIKLHMYRIEPRGGLVATYLKSWFYNPDDPGLPIENTDPEENSAGAGQYYTGKYNDGGVLFYNITGLSEEEIKTVHLDQDPLPYSFNEIDTITVHVSKENGGTLVAPNDRGDPSEYKLLMKLPYSNNFAFKDGSAFAQTQFTPTVSFGVPVVSHSKGTTTLDHYFAETDIQGSVNKDVQSNNMHIGEESHYIISNATNSSNIMVYKPEIIDTLPDSYDFTNFEFHLSNEVLKDTTIDKIINVSNPLEIEVANTSGEKRWLSLGELTQITSDDTKTIFGVKNIESQLSKYIDETSEEYFTGNIKVKYAYPFDGPTSIGVLPKETLPGDIYIFGKASKAITITNSATLSFEINVFNESTITSDHGWQVVRRDVDNDSVDKIVTPPSLWSLTQGLYQSSEGRQEGNIVNGSMSSLTNGFTVRFGSNNPSMLLSGQVVIDVPSLNSIIGFTTHVVTVKKELLEDIDVSSYTLIMSNGTTKEINAVDIDEYLDDDGNVIFSIENEAIVGRLEQLIIHLNHVNGNTKQPAISELETNNKYVEILGNYPFPGILTLNTKIESQYPSDDGQAALQHTSSGKLSFDLPQINIETNGISVQETDIVENENVEVVLNKDSAGYRTRVSSTVADLAPGKITHEIPVEFDVSKITITNDMLKNMEDIDGKLTMHTITITGVDGNLIVIDKDQINSFIDDEGNLIINDSYLQEQFDFEQVKKIEVEFDVFYKDMDKETLEKSFIEIQGKPLRVGNIQIQSSAATTYSITSGVTNPISSDNGTIVVPSVEPEILVQGAITDGTNVSEHNPTKVSIGQNRVGYTFRFGTQSSTRIEPGFLEITLPINTYNENHYRASNIIITKEMLGKMKLDRVSIISIDENENEVTTHFSYEDLGIVYDNEYTVFSEDINISSESYEGIAKKVFIYFDYYQESTPVNEESNDYVFIEGVGYHGSILEATGKISTNYTNLYDLLFNVSASNIGSLDIEMMQPTVETMSHTSGGIHNENTIEVQSDKEITVPIDYDAWYTFKLGNDAPNAGMEDSLFRIDLNNIKRLPSNNIHGFKPEVLIIDSKYMNVFNDTGEGITSIKLIDGIVNEDDSYNSVELQIEDAIIDENGDYTFDISSYTQIHYLTNVEISMNGFMPNIKDDDRMLITLKGKTDWYTYIESNKYEDKQSPDKWVPLSTNALFTTVDLIVDQFDMDTSSINVPLPRASLSADINNYYDKVPGSEVDTFQEDLENNDAVGYVDNQRSYIETAYQRDLTYRYSLYQDSISTADEFTSTIEIPINGEVGDEYKRGFHVSEVLIKEILFNNEYFTGFKLTLYDGYDDSKKVELIKYDENSFIVMINNDLTNTKIIELDENGDLKITLEDLNEFSIETLGKVRIDGNQFITRQKNNDGDIFITGFSDSSFIDDALHGHNDITVTNADTYLRNIKESITLENEEVIYPYTVRLIDEARQLISKMYFDLQIEASYVLETDDDRYTQKSVSTEHERIQNYASTYYSRYVGYNYYNDSDTLTAGYKSLVSIGVDFRQYINDYQSSIPKMDNSSQTGHTTTKEQTVAGVGDYHSQDEAKDGNNTKYVENYAYNTALTVDITVNLPSESYQAYYLKIDPRAVIGENGQHYIQNITFVRDDDSRFTVDGSSLQKNASTWDATTNDDQWYRINLLTRDESLRFSDDNTLSLTHPYYMPASESFQQDDAIKTVIFTLSINQNESFDNLIASSPDFGGWVNDLKDMQDSNMFEFVGRTYKVGTVNPTTSATITTNTRTVDSSGTKNEPRQENGASLEEYAGSLLNNEKEKSTWSLQNYYPKYTPHWYYGSIRSWTTTAIPFTAGDLYSSTAINTQESSKLTTKKGVEDYLVQSTGKVSQNYNVGYIYGSYKPYNINLVRATKPSGIIYETHIDEAYLIDDLPPLSGNASSENGFEGFRPKTIWIKSDLLENASVLDIIDTNNDIVRSISQSDIKRLVDEGNIESIVYNEKTYYILNVLYQDDVLDSELISKSNELDIILNNDENRFYLSTIQLRVDNLNGDGNFASEVNLESRNTYFETNSSTSLIRVFGDVNIINGKETNGASDGINNVRSYIKNDGGSIDGFSSTTYIATMRAFQIPLKVGSTITSLDSGQLYDYQITKQETLEPTTDGDITTTNVANVPQVASYALNFKNEGSKNVASVDGTTFDESYISSLAFEQPVPTQFRIKQISIPATLFKGSKFEISEFNVKIQNNEYDVKEYFVYDTSNDTYILDVEKLFTSSDGFDAVLNRTPITYNTLGTNTAISYQANLITSFSGTYVVTTTDPNNELEHLQAGESLSQSAISGIEGIVDFDDLIFNGTWVDQTLEGIENNSYENEYSIPTIGKNNDSYSQNITFASRTMVATTPVFGAAKQSNITNTTLFQTVYNRVSQLEINQTRGSTFEVSLDDGTNVNKESFAYDGMDDNRVYVDDEHLMPGDRVEYEVVVKSNGNTTNDIPLENPTVRFNAPLGARIIGWQFIESNQSTSINVATPHQILDATDLYGYTTDEDNNPIEMHSSVEYDIDDKDKLYNIKNITIEGKDLKYLDVGGQYKIKVIVEMQNDYDITRLFNTGFENKEVNITSLAYANTRHNYSSYYVFNRTTNVDWIYGHDVNKSNTFTLVQDLTNAAVSDIQQLAITSTNTLRFYNPTQKPSLDFVYPDGDRIHLETVHLNVSNIQNYTLHQLENHIVDINFIKESATGLGNQYFKLSEVPVVKDYLGNNVKIYYKTDEIITLPSSSIDLNGGWTLLPVDSDIAMLHSITQIRFVYENIPAYLDNDASSLVVQPDVELVGIALHNDERTDATTQINQEGSTMEANVNETFIHLHDLIPIQESIIYRENIENQVVYRARPKVEINLQAFDTLDLALEPYQEMPDTLKYGYRPGESFYYKLVVKNNASTNDYELGNGPLENPIIYDKIPTEYLTLDALNNPNYKIYVVDVDGTKNEITSTVTSQPGALTYNIIQAPDYGGAQSLQYVTTSAGDSKPTDSNNETYNPNDTSSSTIEYTMYKIDLSTIDLDLLPGQTLEIIYKVQANEDGLPLTKWSSDVEGNQIDGDVAYLPRFGEYSHYNEALYINPLGNSEIDVRNKMMDMDNLIHEFGVTGKPNDHSDRLEFLNNATTFIPGSSTNSRANSDVLNYNTSGFSIDANNKFFGSNMNSSSKQKVTIGMNNSIDGVRENEQVSNLTRYAPYNATYASSGEYYGNQLTNRGYYQYLMQPRVVDASSIEFIIDNWKSSVNSEQSQNVIWSQHNLHLQKAWISSASEFVSHDNNRYYSNNSDMSVMNNTQSNYISVKTNDDNITALEYDEDFTTRLYAMNYGDYDIDGVEFTYVFPYGVEPIFNEDGSISIDGYMYNELRLESSQTQHKNLLSYEMTDMSTWAKFTDEQLATIHVEILQKPDNDIGVLPSNVNIDPTIEPVDKTRYTSSESNGSWVIKITVDNTSSMDAPNLKKWWNRKDETEYIMGLEIPSRVTSDTTSGNWYDRLYVAPVDKVENSYYQVYDVDYQVSSRGRGYANTIDVGGMISYDNMIVYNGQDPSSLVSPAMMYLNGKNQQNLAVTSNYDEAILQSDFVDINNNDTPKKYALSGSSATTRKPFVRYFVDVGNRDENYNLSLDSFYQEVEAGSYTVNTYLENRYYAAEYNYTSSSGTNNSRINYSYNLEDGGARGTIFDPVFTIVLPYGTMPIDDSSMPYSITKDEIPRIEKGPNGEVALDYNFTLLEWDSSSNNLKNTQLPNDVSDKMEMQNLTKDKFKAYVKYDSDTKQYIVQFIPNDSLTSLEVAKIFNNQLLHIELEVYNYDDIDNAPNIDEDNEINQQINVYLSSKHDIFRYTSDSMLSLTRTLTNPYQVNSKKVKEVYAVNSSNSTNIYNRFSADPRLDSIKYVSQDTTNKYATSGGYTTYNYVGSTKTALGKIEVINQNDKDYIYPTGQRSNNEIDSYVTLPLQKTISDVSFSDMNVNNNYYYNHDMTSMEGIINDSYLSNSVVLKQKKANLTTSVAMSLSSTSNSLETEDLLEPLEYGDELWYTMTLKNKLPDHVELGIFDADTNLYRVNLENAGTILHATYTNTLYLPDSLRYDDSFNSDDDNKYANYIVEMYDENEKLISSYTNEELEAMGWDVEVKSFAVNPLLPSGKQFVRATIVNPGTSGTNNTNILDKNNRPAGQLLYNESIVLKIQTRVADIEGLDQENVWNEENSARLYTNLHGLDGSVIDFETLEPIDENDKPYAKQLISKITHSNILESETTIYKDIEDDFDKDGMTSKIDPEIYSYDYTGVFDISKPKSFVRSNTIKVRSVYEKDPVTQQTPSSDATYRAIENQYMLINEATLTNGSANEFIVQFDIPYRGSKTSNPNIALPSDPKVEVLVEEFSTGKWMIPKDATDYDELLENLRVYVYVRYQDENEKYPTVLDAHYDNEDSGWTLINPDGNNIEDNEVYENNQPEQIYQVMWVVKHQNDPNHYPIPDGFRLDIDADENTEGIQEVSEVDPVLDYANEALHGEEFNQNVIDNSIKLKLRTSLIENQIHTHYMNFYTSVWAKYSDEHYDKVYDKSYRSGYEVVVENPYMDLYEETHYLKNKFGIFVWDEDLTIKLSTSKVLRHEVRLYNVEQATIDTISTTGELEDTLSNPTISVGLPIREPITADNFHYQPYDEINGFNETVFDLELEAKGVAIRDQIYKETPWTVYIEELDGTRYAIPASTKQSTNDRVRLTFDGEVIYDKKHVDLGNERTTMTFNFNGQLLPGQEVVVVYMAVVSDGLNSGNAEDLQSKFVGQKDGSFQSAKLPTETSMGDIIESTVAIRADHYDIDNDSNTHQIVLELYARAGVFETNDIKEVKKSVSTALDGTNVVQTVPKPIALQEGGDYTFTTSLQSLNTAGLESAMAPVLFDILPYAGDVSINGSLQSDGEYRANSRGSMWKGYLDIDSIKVNTYNREIGIPSEILKYYEVPKEHYKVYVGPFTSDGSGGYIPKVDSEGNPILPSLNSRSDDDFYAEINEAKPGNILETDFIELETLKNSGFENYDELVRNITSIVVRFNEPEEWILYGQGRYELIYTMRAPLNLPAYPGDLPTGLSSDELEKEYANYVSWNTMVGASTPYNVLGDLSGTGVEYQFPESKPSGVFINAPANRGYIGDYVWYDDNADGITNEAIYSNESYSNRQTLDMYNQDFDGDGVLDDPGINGVKVELLTEKGYVSNKNGQAIQAIPDSSYYYVINQDTGEIETLHGTYVTTRDGPVSTITTSDYRNHQGYFILSDLAPGNYKLRYTIPEEYNEFGISTTSIKGEAIEIIKAGENLPVPSNAIGELAKVNVAPSLVVTTGTITIDALINTTQVEYQNYDANAMSAKLGIARPVRFGGTIWDDAKEDIDAKYQFNGIFDEEELGILDVTIKAYLVGSDEVAIGFDGKELITTSRNDGTYHFENLVPNQTYQFKITDTLISGQINKATPEVKNPTNALILDNDNDGVNKEKDNRNYVETTKFTAAYIRDNNGVIELDEGDGKVKINTTIDIGLVTPDGGAIGNYIWIDENKDGMYSENEQPYTNNLELNIEAYYFDDEWIPLPEGILTSEQTKVTSSSTGTYLFNKLPGTYNIYYDIDGNVTDDVLSAVTIENFIIGYKVKVPIMPDGYYYTLVNMDVFDELDSDLLASTYLTSDNEYVIVAKEMLEANHETKTISVVENGTTIDKHYSISENEFILNKDVGLLEYINTGSVAGRIFNDENYNGVHESETGIKGVTVILERQAGTNTMNDIPTMPYLKAPLVDSYYEVNTDNEFINNELIAEYEINKSLDEPFMSADGEYIEVIKTTTDENGQYTFEDIPQYEVAIVDEKVTYQPIRYRIRMIKPINTDLTISDVDSNQQENQDSDFKLFDYSKPRESISHSFVLGNRINTTNTTLDGFGNAYLYHLQNNQTNVDGGLIIYPQNVILGDKVWQDDNEDGYQDANEKGISGVQITLYKYDPTISTTVYNLDENNLIIGTKEIKGKWVVATNSDGSALTTYTDENGEYKFTAPAYYVDPLEESYLQPYHYRVKATYTSNSEEWRWSPYDNLDSTTNSDGYWHGNIIPIEDIATRKSEELSDVIIDNNSSSDNSENTTDDSVLVIHPTFNTDAISPLNTPVGNIFGITLQENEVISREFVIADVYLENLTNDNVINDILYKMIQKDNGIVMPYTQEIIVDDSTVDFEKPLENDESIPEDITSLIDKTKLILPVNTRIYVNWKTVRSDNSIDFGIKDPSLEPPIILPPDTEVPPTQELPQADKIPDPIINVDTSDNSQLFKYTILLTLCGVVILIVIKKKHNQE